MARGAQPIDRRSVLNGIREPVQFPNPVLRTVDNDRLTCRDQSLLTNGSAHKMESPFWFCP
jgi:hypothetical protein